MPLIPEAAQTTPYIVCLPQILWPFVACVRPKRNTQDLRVEPQALHGEAVILAIEANVFALNRFSSRAIWAAKGKVVKLRVADKAQKAYKLRVRQLTRCIGGKGMAEVAHKLKQYVNGWKAYFKLADTPMVWRELDEWMRHRLRAIQLRQRKRGSTMYRELTKLGAPQGVAERVAGNSRCWWRNSNGLIKTVLTI